MENASKALIMAGSILIALLTIGALMFMFDNISEVERQKDQNAEIEELLEFNRQFEQYDAVGLRGSDLITVMNKIVNYNEKVIEDDDGYNTVKMKIVFKEDFKAKIFTATGVDEKTYNKDVDTHKLEYDEINRKHTGNLNSLYDAWITKSKDLVSEQKEQLTEFKRKYFKCTGIEYDNTSGRVSSMSFEQIIVQ